MLYRKGELLNKAIVLATNAHAGQLDRGKKPYILHPLRVMMRLNTDDEELQCIAILHDVVEDCNVTWKDLQDEGFSERIIDGVKGLTKLPGETYEENKEKIFVSKDRMLVKLSDLQDNSDLNRLKGISEKDIKRTIRYMKLFHEIKTKLELYGT